MANFKQLRGNRLLLTAPVKEESKVILSAEAQEEANRRYLLEHDRLTVYAVGDLVMDIKPGDEVMIDLMALQGKPVRYTIDGAERLLISIFDVILVW